VSAPFFGPNVWTGILKPVTGGGIPARHAFVEMKLTFKDGGAFDFHSIYERIRESLTQAMEIAREAGNTVDPSNVHLEQLPAYEDVNQGGALTSFAQQHQAPLIVPLIAPTPIRPTQTTGPIPANYAAPSPTPLEPQGLQQNLEPDEPPPGYEEAQSTNVMNSVEDSIRRSNA